MANINELIPIEERNGQQAVNARHLYRWLDVKKDFSDWIKAQIVRCDLTENEDFEVFPLKVENSQGGRPSIEYALSMNAAKEISMMSQSKKGKEARRYFIDCERKLKNITMTALPDFTNPAEAARAWAVEYEQKMLATKRAEEAEQRVETLNVEVEKREAVIKEQMPKVEQYDMFMGGFGDNKNVSIRTFCNQARIDGEKLFWDWLFAKKMIYRGSNGTAMPYADYADIFVMKDVINRRTGWSGRQIMVQGDKKAKLAKIYYKEHPERFFKPIVKTNKQLNIWQ